MGKISIIAGGNVVITGASIKLNGPGPGITRLGDRCSGHG